MQTTLSGLMPREHVRGFGSRTAARYCSGTLWPHGEWSFGYASERPDGGEWHDNPLQVSERAEQRIRDDWALAQFPFDLSVAANSHTAAKRGLKGISGYGQQMTKAAGHLMQKHWPRHRKTLGTITLPEMSQEARREVVSAWPEIVRQLLQWQGRRLRRLGLPPVVVSVSEIQPKRLVESGQACLHLHQLWLNVPAKSGRWTFSPTAIRSFVDRLLRRKCPSYVGGFINVDTKPVEGTVAAYLAKYMSKGKQQIDEALADWGPDNCPATWWNMTAAARAMVKASLMKGREVGDALQHALNMGFEHGPESYFYFLKQIEIEYDGHRYTAGWRGRFTEEVDRYTRALLKSFDIEGLVRLPA